MVRVEKLKEMEHRGTIIWDKNHAARKAIAVGSLYNKPSPTDSYECIVIYRKGKEDRNGRKGGKVTKEFMRDMANIWRVQPDTSAQRNFHPATMPLKLADKIIHYFTFPPSKKYGRETVLDPFAGLGTTIVSATRNGRNAIGFELSKKYCEIARGRVQTELSATPQKPIL